MFTKCNSIREGSKRVELTRPHYLYRGKIESKINLSPSLLMAVFEFGGLHAGEIG